MMKRRVKKGWCGWNALVFISDWLLLRQPTIIGGRKTERGRGERDTDRQTDRQTEKQREGGRERVEMYNE